MTLKNQTYFKVTETISYLAPKIWSLESEIFETVKKKVETRLSSQTSMMGLFRKNSERLLVVN